MKQTYLTLTIQWLSLNYNKKYTHTHKLLYKKSILFLVIFILFCSPFFRRKTYMLINESLMVIHSGMIHSSYDYLPTWSKQAMITNHAFNYRLKTLQWIIFLALHSCVFEGQLLENSKCKTYRLILKNTLRIMPQT